MFRPSEKSDTCKAAKAIGIPEVLPLRGHERCGCKTSQILTITHTLSNQYGNICENLDH